MNAKEKKEFELKKSMEMKAKIEKLDSMIKMVCRFIIYLIYTYIKIFTCIFVLDK